MPICLPTQPRTPASRGRENGHPYSTVHGADHTLARVERKSYATHKSVHLGDRSTRKILVPNKVFDPYRLALLPCHARKALAVCEWAGSSHRLKVSKTLFGVLPEK